MVIPRSIPPRPAENTRTPTTATADVSGLQDTARSIFIDDNARVLQRIVTAIADKTGRLRLLIGATSCTAIPGFELSQLRGHLRELDCSNSPYLSRLPMEIGHLYQTLRRLDCSGCALTSLPDEISVLVHLEYLNCSRNRLESFLWNCDALESLRHLDLSHNVLRYLSPSAAQRLLSPSRMVLLLLAGNEPTLRQTARDSNAEQRALLPVHIDRCAVCDDIQAKLPPNVFVRFIKWRPTPDSAGQVLLVPVLYPCCGAECAIALQRWQSDVALLELK